MDNINDIYKDIEEIEYGWIDNKGGKHYKLSTKELVDSYILQSPDKLMESKLGLCLEQVELERYKLDNIGIKNNSYMIYYDGEDKYKLHTFLVFIYNNSFYLFEHAWSNNKGIHKYNNINDIFSDVKNILIDMYLKDGYDEERFHFYKYNRPIYDIDYMTFLKHCLNSEEIKYR